MEALFESLFYFTPYIDYCFLFQDSDALEGFCSMDCSN